MRETGAVTTLPSSEVVVAPESSVPSGASTWIAPGDTVTAWLNRSRISCGGVSSRDCVTGCELSRITCPSAAFGASSVRSAQRRRARLTAHSPRTGRRSSRSPGRRIGARPAGRTSSQTPRATRPDADGAPARAGRAPRRRASSQSRGGETQTASTASRSARARGTRRPRRGARLPERATTRGSSSFPRTSAS